MSKFFFKFLSRFVMIKRSFNQCLALVYSTVCIFHCWKCTFQDIRPHLLFVIQRSVLCIFNLVIRHLNGVFVS